MGHPIFGEGCGCAGEWRRGGRRPRGRSRWRRAARRAGWGPVRSRGGCGGRGSGRCARCRDRTRPIRRARAGRGRQAGDGRITQRGQDVPRSGDGEEDQRGWDEVESGEKAELAGDGEVEKDEGERKDEADEALGEKVEGGDGGEDQARNQGGAGFYDPPMSR